MAEDLAIQAARILLSIRNRRLRQWPEWVEKEPSSAGVEVSFPDKWPKWQRSGNRMSSDRRAAMLLPKQGLVAASAYAVASASSSGVEREHSRRPDSLADYVAPAESGPSTSADRKERPRHAVEMAAKASPAEVAAPRKELMEASSPETPLDFGGAAAGSGVSSSCDDAARRPLKRRAPGTLGSGGGASSGDEGCSLPDKLARVAADDGDAEKEISEPKMQTPDNSEKGVKFAIDLNMPCPEDDDECPGFC